MSEKTLKTRILLKSDTAEAWTEAGSSQLCCGELGFETDTGLFKIGDGNTSWTDLPYLNCGSYQLNVISAAGDKIKDRCINTIDTTGALSSQYQVEIPEKRDELSSSVTDFILIYNAASTYTLTLPAASDLTIYGDIPSTDESGLYLVTFTELKPKIGTSPAEYYIKKIQLEQAE